MIKLSLLFIKRFRKHFINDCTYSLFFRAFNIKNKSFYFAHGSWKVDYQVDMDNMWENMSLTFHVTRALADAYAYKGMAMEYLTQLQDDDSVSISHHQLRDQSFILINYPALHDVSMFSAPNEAVWGMYLWFFTIAVSLHHKQNSSSLGASLRGDTLLRGSRWHCVRAVEQYQ